MQKTDTNYKRFLGCKFLSFRGRSPWNLKNLHPLNDERFFAFTLAEVLITLTIIGVIAALTIPNLMQSYKKHEVEVGVKEAYNTLSNALTLARAENGYSSFSDMAKNGYSMGKSDFAEQNLFPYLKISKKCEDYRECLNFYSYTYIRNADGTDFVNWGGAAYYWWPSVQLENGMLIGVSLNQYYDIKSVFFLVDINGQKEPNMAGKDIFFFFISESCETLYSGPKPVDVNLLTSQPRNSKVIGIDYTCKNSNTFGCAGLIMRNGWKIPDDYPIKKF